MGGRAESAPVLPCFGISGTRRGRFPSRSTPICRWAGSARTCHLPALRSHSRSNATLVADELATGGPPAPFGAGAARRTRVGLAFALGRGGGSARDAARGALALGHTLALAVAR